MSSSKLWSSRGSCFNYAPILFFYFSVVFIPELLTSHKQTEGNRFGSHETETN